MATFSCIRFVNNRALFDCWPTGLGNRRAYLAGYDNAGAAVVALMALLPKLASVITSVNLVLIVVGVSLI